MKPVFLADPIGPFIAGVEELGEEVFGVGFHGIPLGAEVEPGGV